MAKKTQKKSAGRKSPPSKKPAAKAKSKAAHKAKSSSKPKRPVAAAKAKVKPDRKAKAGVKPAPALAKKPEAPTIKGGKAATVPVKGKLVVVSKNGRPAFRPPMLPPPTPPPKPIRGVNLDELPAIPAGKRPPLPAGFLKKQRTRLLELRTHLLDSMEGVAKDSIRTRPEGSEASVGGMHMGDAGSDAYDRDFALSLLSKEQDALYEIQEALKRIDNRSYGYCEMTGKRIPEERLEALPFTRFTREAQEQIERNQFAGGKPRPPQRSVFNLDDESESEDDEGEEEETPTPPANESSLDFMKE